MRLDDIGRKWGTDKSSLYHDYLTRLEPYLLSQPRPLRLLEIGVLHGRSIRMWLEYFPESRIFGADIICSHDVCDPRFTFYHLDAAQPWLWDRVDKFNVIIDDGSHRLKEVADCYNQGFNHVESGGIFVIEDTCRSNYSPLQLMAPTVDELQGHDADWCGNPGRDIGRVAFVHFLKGLIVIGRK